MNIYKEIKEIAKCNSKIKRLADKVNEKMQTDNFSCNDIEWETARLVTMSRKDLEKLDLVDDDYYSEHHRGYLEDDFYGWLYFKTDVPGQYVKVHFSC